MASALLLRTLPLRSPIYRSATASAAAVIAAALSRRHLSGLSDDPSNASVQPTPTAPTKSLADVWINEPVYRQWKEKEAEMLRDIQPTVRRTKEILHSNRQVHTVCAWFGFQCELDFKQVIDASSREKCKFADVTDTILFLVLYSCQPQLSQLHSAEKSYPSLCFFVFFEFL